MSVRLRSILIVSLFVLGGFAGFLDFGSENAQGTPVSGPISADTTWDLSGSPYIVVDNVSVLMGATLTIDPGVEVRFDGYYSLIIYGDLHAIGTDSDRILITSNKPAPARHFWNGIHAVTGAQAEISYCTISYGTYNILLESSDGNNITNNRLLNGAYGIRLSSADNNVIANNTISNNSGGISLYWGANYNIIKHNDITDNEGTGVNIGFSSNNNVTENNISLNSGIGIDIGFSANNWIINNTLDSNYKVSGSGIYIEHSTDNIIIGNKLFNDGFSIWGDDPSHYGSHTIPDNNLVNGKRVHYHKNCNGITIDGIVLGQLLLANCTNVNVRNLQINNTFLGIELGYSNNITLVNNSVSSISEYGILLILSSNNKIMNNSVYLNQMKGIFIHYFSSNNSIAGNSISSNKYGITISEDTENNRIFHNDFVKNEYQARDYSGNNYWNDTYPSGGNYWTGYSTGCSDNFNGSITPQTAGNPDGICDHKYDINSAVADYYPFTRPIANRVPDTIPPDVWAGDDIEVQVGIPFALNGKWSSDDIDDQDQLNFTWKITRDSNIIAILYGIQPILTLNETGKYEVNLTVRDTSGNEGCDIMIIDVNPDAPEGRIPWILFIIILAIILSLAVIYLILRRMKKRQEPPDSQENSNDPEEVDINQ
jgi:parallel beta-helix repeat protein